MGRSSSVTSLLAKLGDEQKTVILLRILGDLSLEETARVVGKSVGAVKQLQRRGLLALREHAEAGGRHDE
jgi:RNA polymerase sigma-70 factor (ECF subfamily)